MIQVESWSQVVLWIFPWALVALWSKVLRPWNCLADHCQLCQWCIQYWSGSRLPHRPGEYKFVSFQCGYDFNMTLSMTFSMTCKCHVIKTFDCAQKQTHQGLILNANLQRGHPLQDCIKNQGGVINHVSTALLLYDLDWQWWLWQDIVNETMANSIGRTTLAACNLLPSISERIWSSPHLLSPGMASHVNASHWVMSC